MNSILATPILVGNSATKTHVSNLTIRNPRALAIDIYLGRVETTATFYAEGRLGYGLHSSLANVAPSASTNVTCTFEADDETVNDEGHGLANGTAVVFYTAAGTMPTGVNQNQVYYVQEAADDTFRISTDFEGKRLVSFSTDGSGTIQYTTLSVSTIRLDPASGSDADVMPLPTAGRLVCTTDGSGIVQVLDVKLLK